MRKQKYRAISVLSIAVFCGIFLFFRPVFAIDWQKLSGEHFKVFFTQDEKFAKEVLNKAEVHYRRIAAELGYSRYSEFWTWDKRVKIYIYLNHSSYLKATGQPQWSEGMADYINKEIVSYAWSEGFTESLLPHEIAHLIFRDFVGFKGEIPLWLDEGVAQWSEEKRRKKFRVMAKQYFEENKMLLVEDLMNIDIRRLKELEKVYIRPTITKDGKPGILFLSAENLVATYYLQAVSIIDFLIERYGSARFSHFCRQLRDGKRLEEALKFAYAAQIPNLKILEKRWREYLAE